MKKNLIVTALVSLLLAAPAFAAGARVSVNGMVCAFCAQGIKKNFAAKEAVEKVDVNLDQKIVSLNFRKDKSLTDDEITDVIKRAGFAVSKIEREGDKK